MPAAPTIRTPPPGTVPATIEDGEIGARLRRHAEAARGAFAANTERALKGDIARFTGSKYRWIATEVSRLTRIGVLRRVAPNTYAIDPGFEAQS